ncbi:hypothetical protein F5Y14DRAFT_445974 [Nemania sp. NC0429]|nr:hypothetical protein F5Y14DRAFT_445974 [Nemania sp. NC0429]
MQPITIISKYSFSETQKALEQAVPLLDSRFLTCVAQGDYAGALVALQAVPSLNHFIDPPGYFTAILLDIENNGQEITYEMGNLLTVATMIRYKLDIAPQVLLQVNGDKAEFKFCALAPSVARFHILDVDNIAKKLDEELTNTLRRVAGYYVSS